jgi:hypothetical protein
VTLNLKKFQADQEMLFREAEEFNRQQVEFAHIRVTADGSKSAGDSTADPLSEKRKEWISDLRKDPVLEEAIQVLNDWRELAPVQ